MSKQIFNRMSANYSMLRTNLNKQVAIQIAAVFAHYPVNSKGKWFFEYEKLLNKLDKNQKVGFTIKKLNAIANREKINRHFYIKGNSLFKEEEITTKNQLKAARLFHDKVEPLVKWTELAISNKKDYLQKNEQIINLCILLMDNLKKNEEI